MFLGKRRFPVWKKTAKNFRSKSKNASRKFGNVYKLVAFENLFSKKFPKTRKVQF